MHAVRHALPALQGRRILAIIDTVQVSGPGRQLAAALRELERRGLQTRVLVFRRRGRDVSPYETYLAAQGLGFDVVEEHGPLDVGVIRRASAVLDAWRPDVIQTHGYKPGAVAALLRARGRRTPWAAFFHGATTENLKVRLYHALDRRVMRLADAIVVMSRHHLGEFDAVRGKTRIIYNAVLEQGAASPVPLPPAPPWRLAVIGRLSSEKGVDVLLAACAKVQEAGLDFTLTVAGDGPDRVALEAQADALGLRERVEFLGHQRDVGPLYDAHHLIVIPSRSEGLPNVLLEALRHDRAAVATTVGAIPEVITTRGAGSLVPPGDPEALASAIVATCDVRRLAEGTADRAATAARFSLDARVGAMLALYDAVARPVSGPAA